MNLTTRLINVSDEKNLIINMIMNDSFVESIYQLITNNLQYLKSNYSRTLIEWTIDFYNQFKEAPKFQIKDIFENQKDFLKKEESESIEKLLVNLNNDYLNQEEKFNLQYELKKATNYIQLQRLISIKNRLEDCIRDKKIIEAENTLTDYQKVEQLESIGVDLLTDKEFVIKALENQEQEEILFNLHGTAREYFGDFCRGDFAAVLAPAKRGKTFVLMELAKAAIEMNNKVLFISMEMTEKELTRRFWSSFTGKPLKKSKELKIPYFVDNIVDYKEIELQPLDSCLVSNYMEDILLHRYKASIKLLAYPMYSKSVADLKNILNNLEYLQNWCPDVIIIDYADILMPDRNQKEYRHQINSIWVGLRNLAQERNICVITASQSVAQANKRDLEQADAAEDKRKLAHVTKMFGINQTSIEKEKGLIRYVMLEDRHREFFLHKELLALECRSIGRVLLDSRMKDEVKNYSFLTQDEKKKSKDK